MADGRSKRVPTVRARRLGRELARLRTEAGLTLREAAHLIGERSYAWLNRIETAQITLRSGDLLQILMAYGVPTDAGVGLELYHLSREARGSGWWRRLGTLSNRLVEYIAFEADATSCDVFDPMLVPGLLQTEDYARAVISAAYKSDPLKVDEMVMARLKRQEVLTRHPDPLILQAIITEAALSWVIGSHDVLQDQLVALIELSKRPNITLQVLPFTAGAFMAARGNQNILRFPDGLYPDLGFSDTPVGGLFIESKEEVGELGWVFDTLKQLALSPQESRTRIKERCGHL